MSIEVKDANEEDDDQDLESLCQTQSEIVYRCPRINQADRLFAKVDISGEGWSYSGSDPPAVCEDDKTISIAGTKWHPQLDVVEVQLPNLHSNKKLIPRLMMKMLVIPRLMRNHLLPKWKMIKLS